MLLSRCVCVYFQCTRSCLPVTREEKGSLVYALSSPGVPQWLSMTRSRQDIPVPYLKRPVQRDR